METHRLLYTSVARSDDVRSDQIVILGQSRANNGLDGVTGILWTDDISYLQVLEGSSEAVAAVFSRISNDNRHSDIRVLIDITGTQRVFSDWAMAGLLRGETNTEMQTRLGRLLRSASDEVRGEFEAAIAGSTFSLKN